MHGASLAEARTIGVVRTDHLGDMVLTLPLVNALRQEFPSATIALIAHSRTAPLVEWAPSVDRCYFVDQIPFERVLRHERFDALFFRAHVPTKPGRHGAHACRSALGRAIGGGVRSTPCVSPTTATRRSTTRPSTTSACSNTSLASDTALSYSARVFPNRCARKSRQSLPVLESRSRSLCCIQGGVALRHGGRTSLRWR